MAAIIATAQNYWISTSALTITLNALGEANRVQASVASGAQIMCYIRGVDGLDFDEGHNYRRWPLTVSPTFFNTNTHKYLYVVIPRTTAIGTQAMVWFPSQLLDINGCAIDEEGEPAEQVGNPDYYYIWLQGIISSSGASGNTPRTWEQQPQTGTLATDEAVSPTGGFWYQWDAISQTVTFLKDIWMDAASQFRNLILGGKTLTGVAVDDTTPDDSTTHVATPAYIKAVSSNRYIRKDQDDVTPFNLGVEQNFDVGRDVSIGGMLRGNEIQSDNYSGDGMADTGFRLTKDDNTGSSKLTVDNLYVRKKATFEEVEVKKETAIAGNQIYSSAANIILRTDYYDGDGNLMGYSIVQVPWMLKKMPFLLRMLSRASRTGFFGRQRKIRLFLEREDIPKIRRVRCYFLAKDDDREVKNMWRVEEHYPNDYPDVSKRGQLIPGTGNDLARCQTMNLHNSNRSTYIHGMETKLGNIYWWRKLCGVSTDPVMGDDGREYHYFDVMFDYNAEQQYRQQGQPCPWCDLASGDIPAAGDHVVQFGNDMNPDRMNLIAVEVNSSSDAPAHKWYRGIYTFDLSRCWWGGNPRKDMISAASGVEFYGPSFKVQTEYGTAKVPKDRPEVNWSDITTQRDDYSPYANVRKCYNYDAITHNGCRWLCLVPEGMHWVRPQVWNDPTYALYDNNDQYRHNGNYISNIEYTALTADQKSQCGRIPNYTTAEPGTDAAIWKQIVSKGDDGYTPQKGIDYFDGQNGKDGWMVQAAPANVIISQNISNKNLFTSATVSFSAKKGNVAASIVSVGTPTSTTFNVSKSGNNVVVSSPKTNGNQYYNQGDFSVQVIFRDPDSSSNVSFTLIVLCYANLLGSWEETVIGDTKTEIANQDYYYYDASGDVVRKTTLGEYIRSSQSASSNLKATINGKTTESYVNQKANEIDEGIRDDLGDTGINITSGEIKLKANKVNFYDSSGTNLNSKIWLDSTYGTLHAVDGEFEGKVTAEEGTIGGFAIGSETLGTEYSSGTTGGTYIRNDGYMRIYNVKNYTGLSVIGGAELIGAKNKPVSLINNSGGVYANGNTLNLNTDANNNNQVYIGGSATASVNINGDAANFGSSTSVNIGGILAVAGVASFGGNIMSGSGTKTLPRAPKIGEFYFCKGTSGDMTIQVNSGTSHKIQMSSSGSESTSISLNRDAHILIYMETNKWVDFKCN